MSAPAAAGPRTCPECGQSLIVQSRPCVCGPGHGEAGHEIGKNGQRTWCLHFGPAGKCPCKVFTPAEASS